MKRMHKLGTILLVMLLLFAAGCGTSTKTEPAQTANPSEAPSEAPEATIQQEESPPSYQALKVGDQAPDFTAATLDGEEVTLSDFKGKTVFLNFWATWCGPCVMEMPEIQKLHDTYDKDEFVILAVNSGEKTARVQKFLDENPGYVFKVLLDETYAVGDKYPTPGIPYSLVVDKDGLITFQQLGSSTFEVFSKAVDEALGAPK